MAGKELHDPADTFDASPRDPFSVSEHYTPESACYVSAHRVAYKTVIVSYGHHVNLSTKRVTRGDSQTAVHTRHAPDILFVAVSPRMQCKQYRECIQTMPSEHYRFSAEAVFVAGFIANDHDMVGFKYLVTTHLLCANAHAGLPHRLYS